MTTNHETVGDVSPDFGDYVLIEQKRYGVPNEMYVHKVVGRLRSNTWVDVPVQTPATATMHDTIEDAVACICCGVDETQVLRYRLSDVKPHRAHAADAAVREAVRKMAQALESGEWAEHVLDSDDDVSRLEAQITRLVGAHAAGAGRVPEGWRIRRSPIVPALIWIHAPGRRAVCVVENSDSERAATLWLLCDRLLSAAPDPKPAPEAGVAFIMGGEGWDDTRYVSPQPAPSDARANMTPEMAEFARARSKMDAKRAAQTKTDAPASPQAAHSPATNGATEPCDALDGAAPCACGAWHSGPQAAQGETAAEGRGLRSHIVTIEAHWLQTIKVAATLLEQSACIMDQREGAALRKLLASAKPAWDVDPSPALVDSVALAIYRGVNGASKHMPWSAWEHYREVAKKVIPVVTGSAAVKESTNDALLAEARALAERHPSKDARAFAESVAEYLTRLTGGKHE